jgi:two-component system sporulation sensor kinase A
MDITEQKRLEHALSESNTRLQQITDSMFDMVSLTDTGGVYKYVSPSIRKTLGYEPNDLLDKTIFDFLHPDDLPRVMEEVQKVLQTRTPSRTEYRYRHADGRYLWLEGAGNFVLDDKGEMVGAVFSSHDVTERKMMEEKLHKSEESFRGIAERSFDAIATVDLEGTITYASPSVRIVLGFPHAEVIGKSFLEYFQPVQLSNATRLFSDLLQGKKIEGLQLDLQKRDGTLGTVEINASPIVTKGEVTGIQAVFRDITQRKQIEEALRESEEKFKAISGAAYDAIILSDDEGKIIYWNPAAERIFQYTEDDVHNKGLNQFIIPERFQEAVVIGSKAFKETGTGPLFGKTVDMMSHRKDGTEFPMELSMTAFKMKGKWHALGLVKDVTERKRMEEAIRESEERLRRLIELAPIAIYMNDLEGNFVGANKQAEELTGYKLEELAGKNMLEVGLISEEDLPKAMKGIQKNLRGEESGPDEYRITKKDGTTAILEQSSFPVARAGKVEVIGIARDITQRKKMEDALRESEEKIRNILRSSPDAIVVTELDGTIVDCNDAAINLSGLSTQEELRGKNSYELISKGSYEKAMKAMERLFELRTVRNLEYNLIAKDGHEFPAEVSISLMLDASGAPKYIIATIEDITERKNMENLLKQSEERFRGLAERSFDTIVTADQEGHITYVSPAATRMLGYSPEELVQKPFQEYIKVTEASKALEAFAQLAQGGSIKSVQLEILRKDGSQAIVEVNAFPIFQNEEVVGIQATVRDVTERQQMLKKLEEYSQQLEQMVDKRTRQLKETQEQLVKAERLAAIGQVAAMVGHDLRNPLTGIKGAAYYLKTKPTLKMDQKSLEMLELIERDVEYSNKIITDLMDYSREIRLELTETDPNSIMKEALSLVQIPNNVQIVDNTQNQPKTKLDMEKIKRVFSNLIKNAVDAMPNGGELSISSKQIDGSVEFSFVDTGMGMAKEVMEKLWTPFFTTKAKGMGLGLAISKRHIEAHGGKISVESIVGEGTAFTVTVPIEPKSQEGGERVWVNMPESLLSTTTKA